MRPEATTRMSPYSKRRLSDPLFGTEGMKALMLKSRAVNLGESIHAKGQISGLVPKGVLMFATVVVGVSYQRKFHVVYMELAVLCVPEPLLPIAG